MYFGCVIYATPLNYIYAFDHRIEFRSDHPNGPLREEELQGSFLP